MLQLDNTLTMVTDESIKRLLSAQSMLKDGLVCEGLQSAGAVPAITICVDPKPESIFSSKLEMPQPERKRGSSRDPLDSEPPKKVTKTEHSSKFRPYQAEKWHIRFAELLAYRNEHQHCLVPHTFPPNPELARWVKRQRYQYNLLMKGKKSAMTHERVKKLEDIGFVWDSHEITWQEKRNELLDFKKLYGHCNVPTGFTDNPQLATWIKCQRRQYKLFSEGKPSNITAKRIVALEELGFRWEVRTSRGPEKDVEEPSGKSNSKSPLVAEHGVQLSRTMGDSTFTFKRQEVLGASNVVQLEAIRNMLVLEALRSEYQSQRNILGRFNHNSVGANNYNTFFSQFR